MSPSGRNPARIDVGRLVAAPGGPRLAEARSLAPGPDGETRGVPIDLQPEPWCLGRA